MIEIDPSTTDRATAFELWRHAPMPMVTFVKTFFVGRIFSLSRKRHLKFNALMCYCIARAANGVEEFFSLPVGDKFMRFNHIAVNVVVNTERGGIATCDVPYTDDFAVFYADYIRLTELVRKDAVSYDAGEEYMVIGTSALPDCELDAAMNIYAGIYNNPFLIWGKVRRGFWGRARLSLSFQFHHSQMDGIHASRFLNALQREIDLFK